MNTFPTFKEVCLPVCLSLCQSPPRLVASLQSRREIKMWRKKVRWNVNDHHFLSAAFYSGPESDEFDMNLFAHFVSALRVGSPSPALLFQLSVGHFSLCCFFSSSCKNGNDGLVVCSFLMYTIDVKSMPNTETYLLIRPGGYVFSAAFWLLAEYVSNTCWLIPLNLVESEPWIKEQGTFFRERCYIWQFSSFLWTFATEIK